MKATAVLLTVSFTLVLGLSCGSPNTQLQTSSPIQTVADKQVQTDVLRTVSIFEGAQKRSQNVKLIAAKFVMKYQGGFVEEWKFESESGVFSYVVTLINSTNGGVDFRLTPIPSKQ